MYNYIANLFSKYKYHITKNKYVKQKSNSKIKNAKFLNAELNKAINILKTKANDK